MGADLHVLHVVCSDGFAGVERHVLTSALALRAAGLQVSVIGGAPDMMREPLESADVLWRPAATIWEAASAARGLRPVDIVNTHMTAADLAGVLIGASVHAPVVSTRHFAAHRGRNGVSRAAFGLLRVRIAAQIAVSQFVADRIEGPSEVVRAGVSDLGPIPGLRERTVLIAQRLEAEKETAVAIEAWALLGEARQDWRLDILGRGSQREALERLAQERGLAESVQFAGFRTDVDEWMRRASILVATAPLEPYGLGVLEAMALALPVVATASAGHLETVGAVPGAALYPSGDAGALAAHLAALIDDEGGRGAYGRSLRTRQRESFTLEQQTEATIRVYEKVRYR
ncbi:MAG TPA: glycosyltransferase family 4 protein [Lacisediminihabitans sp.]|uniref:glycosyltransferase family 4 protein n=1 Tax=Lacisediminihabitans sp. TaxID=2787631 RepID=UPI002ED9FEC4